MISRKKSISYRGAACSTAALVLRATFACLALFSVFAQAADGDLEAKVKSAYLYHMTKFVEWPTLPPDVLRICVIGSDQIGGMLEELSNRQVRDHVLRIEVNANDPTRCQVLFLGRAEKRTNEILARIKGLSVLTVSDRDDFVRSGGIVGFYLESGKVKLEINPEAARTANLKISSRLLELARPVSTSN